jgi:hypothetical protein
MFCYILSVIIFGKGYILSEIAHCRLEVLLFKLEILDHKARERAGAITPTFIGPVPVLLQLDFAMEVKQHAYWRPYTMVI